LRLELPWDAEEVVAVELEEGVAELVVAAVVAVGVAAVTPEPNVGAAPEPDLCEPPAVSPLALEIGIWYCLPAGEPGSMCTPDGGPAAATAA
jgi:hypothetical protein